MVRFDPARLEEELNRTPSEAEEHLRRKAVQTLSFIFDGNESGALSTLSELRNLITSYKKGDNIDSLVDEALIEKLREIRLA